MNTRMNTRSQAQENLLGFLKGDTNLLLVIFKCKSNSYWDQCYASLQLSDSHFREMLKSPAVKKDLLPLLRQQCQIVSPLSSVLNQNLSKFESARVGPRNFLMEKYMEYESAMKLANRRIMDIHRTFRDKVNIASRVILHITNLTKHCLESTTIQKQHTPTDVLKILKLLRPYLSVYSSKLFRSPYLFEQHFNVSVFCSIFAGEMSVEKLLRRNKLIDSCNQDDVDAVLEEEIMNRFVVPKEIFVIKQLQHQNNKKNNNNENNSKTGVDPIEPEKEGAKPSKGKRKKSSVKTDVKKPRLFNDTATHSENVLAHNRGEDVIEDEVLDNLEVDWLDEPCGGTGPPIAIDTSSGAVPSISLAGKKVSDATLRHR